MTTNEGIAHRAAAIGALAERRWAIASDTPDARERARQLRDHVTTYVLPRVASLDAPLVVVLLGPTGAGKSSLVNALAGHVVSPSGVLRPTTRVATVVATDADAALLAEGPLRAISAACRYVTEGARPGVALIDSPDIDSVERANRALADALVEAADLCVFVTTASRYADQVPWDVLGRAKARGLPLLLLINRLSPNDVERREVLEDAGRLIGTADLPRIDERADGGIELLGTTEGDVDAGRQALTGGAVDAVRSRIDGLASDRDARLDLARRALAGAIAGLAPLVSRIADDTEAQAARASELIDDARASYAAAMEDLRRELRDGRFLREEVLRQWHSFVNSDQITRFFSSGIGRIRGALVAAIRGTPIAPVGTVEREATSDVVTLALALAMDAARRTAERWSSRTAGAEILTTAPELWSASPSFAAELEPRLHEWVAGIAEDVRKRGAAKRTLAFGASLGVNVVGIAVMLGVFAHTAGLTGAELGVAAGTAFLNQKLLQALFGEASMQDMIGQARARLDAILEARFDAERGRFEALAVPPDDLRALAAELRESVAVSA
ncbi:MAG: dynamin family protein [Chloroflexota bacterium]|nr:dynamin family protein [Chloroflexota bacterium]